jgi:hypothetical protein
MGFLENVVDTGIEPDMRSGSRGAKGRGCRARRLTRRHGSEMVVEVARMKEVKIDEVMCGSGGRRQTDGWETHPRGG